MRRFVVAGTVAASVALAAFAMLPQTVLYPDRCMAYPTVDGVPTQPGQFCLRYIPALGRYEVPPAGVPADASRVDAVTAGPNDVRLAAALLAFGAAFLGTWWLIPFAMLPRPSVARQRDLHER